MGQFDRWAGKYVFDIKCIDKSEQHIEIEISNEERIGMLDCRIMEQGKVVDMDTGKLMRILTTIFQRNYKEEQPTSMEQFVGKNFEILMEELAIQFRWSTRKELEEAKKIAMEEERAKLKGGKKKTDDSTD